jgi:ubiquinone/menaquinone biosynthesis C-methylase UbiE
MESNVFALSIAVAGVAFLSTCGLNKIAFTQVLTPAGWRQPERVVEALQLKPGARVADVGAGDGYFTFRLADAVGPHGHVYAVEVTDKLVDALREETQRRGYTNVTVVRGAFDDPILPDAGIDLAFFSGVFHHVEEREKYFERLRADLAEGGRVAIIDGAPDPLHKLFMPFHFDSAEIVDHEMTAAGYRRAQVFEFLPMMHFQVFVPGA